MPIYNIVDMNNRKDLPALMALFDFDSEEDESDNSPEDESEEDEPDSETTDE